MAKQRFCIVILLLWTFHDECCAGNLYLLDFVSSAPFWVAKSIDPRGEPFVVVRSRTLGTPTSGPYATNGYLTRDLTFQIHSDFFEAGTSLNPRVRLFEDQDSRRLGESTIFFASSGPPGLTGLATNRSEPQKIDRFDLRDDDEILVYTSGRSREQIHDTIVHEMGHTLGLNHYDNPKHFMYSDGATDKDEFATTPVTIFKIDGKEVKQNPSYHLRRYSNSPTHLDEVWSPGNYDLPQTFRQEVKIKIDEIFDNITMGIADFFGGSPSFEEEVAGTFNPVGHLASFENAQLSDLDGKVFDVTGGDFFAFNGSTVPDSVTNDSLEESNVFLANSNGDSLLELGSNQEISFNILMKDGTGGFVTLARGTASITTIPEPSTLALVSIATVALLPLRRRSR